MTNSWGSQDPMEVAKGGTGLASLTSHGALIGNGTGDVVVTSAPSDGQLIIASTAGAPQAAALSVATDEIIATPGAGSLSIGFADPCILPGTGAVTLPSGTTAQQPGTPVEGDLRYNSDDTVIERYEGAAWVPFTQATSSGVLYISTASVSSSTTLDLTFTGVFSGLYVHAEEQGSAVNLTLQFLDGGGSPYTSNYKARVTKFASGYTTSTSTTNIPLTNTSTLGTASGWLYNPTTATGQITGLMNAGAGELYQVAGLCTSSPLGGIRITSSTSTDMTVWLYEYQES